MNLKILYQLFLFILISFNSYSSNLEIQGLSKLNFDDLNSITSIDLSKNFFNQNEINTILEDLYDSDLIFDVILENNNDNYFLTIQENNLIENVYLNGNNNINDDQLKEVLNSKKGTFLNKDSILSDYLSLKNLYNLKGYYNLSVNSYVEKFSNDKVNLIFVINEGNQSSIIDINFFGNDYFSDSFLYSLIKSKKKNIYNFFHDGSNLSSELFKFDTSLIKKEYENYGYLNTQVNFELIKNSLSTYVLNFYIKENERLLVDKILTNFENSQVDLAFNEFKKKKAFKKLQNNFYNKEQILSLVKEFNEFIYSKGINKYIVDFRIQQKDQINSITFFDNKLNNKSINKVIISGNTITKDKTIRSKITFEPGDYINNAAIKENANILKLQKYINDVSIQSIDYQNYSDIEIAISENAKTGSFLFGGSVSSDTGFGLTIGIKDDNLLGTGNSINANIDLKSENTLFKINYTSYPYRSLNLKNNYFISNEDNDLTSSFGYKVKEQSLGYNLDFKYNKDINLSSGFTIINKKGYSGVNNYSYINDSIGNFNNFSLNFGILYNTTNDIFYPSNGYLNKFNFEIYPDLLSDESFYKVRLKNENYFLLPRSENFIFLINNLGITESLNDDKLKTVNSYGLGGLNFKGFDYRGIGPFENNIYLGGNKYFTSTFGYGSSFIFDKKDNINFKLFYTLGSLWDNDYSISDDYNLRSSFGVTFDVLTAVGPISFSYALPIKKENQDKLREFNFSIGSSF